MALLTHDYYCPKLGMASELRILAPEAILRGETKPRGVLFLLPPEGESGLSLLTGTKIAALSENCGVAVVIPPCLQGCYTDMDLGYPFYQSLKFVREYLRSYMPGLPLEAGSCAVAGIGIGSLAALRWASEEPEFFACAGAIAASLDPNALPKEYFTEKRLANLFGDKENRERIFSDFLALFRSSALKRVFLYTSKEDPGFESVRSAAEAFGERASFSVGEGKSSIKTCSDQLGAFLKFYLGGDS